MTNQQAYIELPIYPDEARFEVEARLGNVEFGCDLSVCKGACCTMPGGRGAPVLKSEIPELERVFPLVKKYLPEQSLEVIEREGLWLQELDGSLTIPTIGGKECIFVTWDGEIAFCAIQKAYQRGEIKDFEKPISCHLFPIRIYPEKKNNSYFITYEEISECAGGRERGKKEHIPLLEFLQHPLARALGKERTQMLIRSLESV